MSGSESGVTSGNQKTLEQDNVSNIVAQNEANASSTFDTDSNPSGSNFDSFPKNLNEGKQGKHVPGHNNYEPGKSELTISMKKASNLVNKFSGKGTPVGTNKERVDFGEVIGNYKDPITGKSTPTTIGMIHYSKSGTHIVPARPKED